MWQECNSLTLAAGAYHSTPVTTSRGQHCQWLITTRQATATYSFHLELANVHFERGKTDKIVIYAPAASDRVAVNRADEEWMDTVCSHAALVTRVHPCPSSQGHQCCSCHAQALTWLMTALMRRIFSRWPLWPLPVSGNCTKGWERWYLSHYFTRIWQLSGQADGDDNGSG